MALFRCASGGGGGGTITVTYSSSFYNKTMTCSNGTKTYTKTTTSIGSTEFKVSDEGTWTITCNNVSKTVNVVLNYTTQMAVTKTVTIYSAKKDYITWTDASGNKSVQFEDNETSKSITVTYIAPSQSITFTSSIAKNPSNLSQSYSKTISFSDSVSSIYLMPNNVLYWYGYTTSNMQDITSANGWSNPYGLVMNAPTYNTNNLYFGSASGTLIGIGTKNAVSFSKMHFIVKGDAQVNTNYAESYIFPDKRIDAGLVIAQTNCNTTALSVISVQQTAASKISCILSNSGNKAYVYAMYYET